jgi:thiosulfate reductase cytochrome b subunit
MANWVKVHPPVVRITHWINVLAVLMMVTSGWRIYNASPLFESFTFPAPCNGISPPCGS